MHAVLNPRRSPKATTVVPQGVLPSKGKLCLSHLHHGATITGTCCGRERSWTRGLNQTTTKAETSSTELKYKIHCSMDKLMKRSNISSLQPLTVGCTCGVLVWPHHGPVQEDKLAKISSLVFAGYLLCCLSQHNLFLDVRKACLMLAGLHSLCVYTCRMHTVLPVQRCAALYRHPGLQGTW